MQKKYIVRLSEEERCELRQVIKKLKGSSQKVGRAQILLKADIEGTHWSDERIAEAFDCRTKTVENIRLQRQPSRANGSITSMSVPELPASLSLYG